MIFVTTYHNPDIDGIACTIAYAELQKKLGLKVQATYFGDLSREVEFVKKYIGFFPLKEHAGEYPEEAEFVLVDTADPDAIESTIKPEKVKEIFDHRELVFTGKFKSARLNVEKVGSCATLMTELFRKDHFKPSSKTAVYLYSAIVSNTVNFKNSVTTQRDILAAKWLKQISKVKDNYIKKMFEFKSAVKSGKDLIFLIEQGFAIHEMHGKNIMIAQVEIANLKKIIGAYKSELFDKLAELKKKENLDYTLFSGIDILEGFNILVTIDDESSKFFSKALGIPEIGKKYQTDRIIMRKEIWPKVEKFLVKN